MIEEKSICDEICEILFQVRREKVGKLKRAWKKGLSRVKERVKEKVKEVKEGVKKTVKLAKPLLKSALKQAAVGGMPGWAAKIFTKGDSSKVLNAENPTDRPAVPESSGVTMPSSPAAALDARERLRRRRRGEETDG